MTASVFDRFGWHLLGIAVSLSFITLPKGITFVRYVGGVPLRLADVILMAATIVVARKGFLWRLSIPLMIAIIASWMGLTRGANLDDLYTDVAPLIGLVCAFIAFSTLPNRRALRMLIRYVIFTLLWSAIYCLLVLGHFVASPVSLRSSADTAVNFTNIPRLVTPTHFLAQICLGAAFVLFLVGEVKLRPALALAIPSAIIVTLAGTRLTLIMLAIPCIAALWRSPVRALRKGSAMLAGLSVLATSAFFLPAGNGINSFNSSEYLVNIINRVGATLVDGQLDESSMYRALEVKAAVGPISNHFFEGLGFGVPYTTPLVSALGTTWLVTKGVLYVHNGYVWLVLKVGFVGLLLSLAWFVRTLSISRKRPSSPLGSVIVAVLIVNLVWNTIGGYPDSIAFGALCGLYAAWPLIWRSTAPPVTRRHTGSP